ncbi:hypothetical protein LF41_452 [Lysobacter dokdonensis DS-58]|uniref:Lipoprotein n=1 Tax=Lysobacter dokdonensis DS-58 TaxID=1300345 RepID=A0A0A2WG06_9GAMM|nr:hypothetical protein [Lysobacter dokdonensis]KGQ18698.1 hypothetical protein LF41_452 [Lysobacter dokdonensis DS-58]
MPSKRFVPILVALLACSVAGCVTTRSAALGVKKGEQVVLATQGVVYTCDTWRNTRELWSSGAKPATCLKPAADAYSTDTIQARIPAGARFKIIGIKNINGFDSANFEFLLQAEQGGEVLIVEDSMFFDLAGIVPRAPDRPARSGVADNFVCMIDESVADEKDKLLPNGRVTQPYSPMHWQTYWDDRADALGRESFAYERARGYAGPSARTLMLYALQQRREYGLPDLVPQARNVPFVSSLYAELGHDPRTSCEILDYPSPVCTLGPAQRPVAMEFRRECGVAPDKAFAPRPLAR